MFTPVEKAGRGAVEVEVVGFIGATLDEGTVKDWIGRTVVLEEEVTVRCAVGLGCVVGRVNVGDDGTIGEGAFPSSTAYTLGAGDGDGGDDLVTNGSLSEVSRDECE